jgi:Ca2+-binding EF-hand superfamily protein
MQEFNFGEIDNNQLDEFGLPTISPVKKSLQIPSKSIVTERVAWMSRTSDIVGSHLKTDLDSYLSLIRRKIQEKCATTQDLITQIRRNKIGESGHVTPNEFRFTLIKFGVILAQPLVDRIFAVFDSDRSGTMDFDEFAMWIMNSEFKPVIVDVNAAEIESPEECLRKKLLNCIEKFPEVFRVMKKKITFLEFMSDISKTQMFLSEKDARKLFLLFDNNSKGLINSLKLINWAKSGYFISPPSSAPRIQIPSISDAIKKICGVNTRQMEVAFAHIKKGDNVKMSFEEFRRSLIEAGLGINISDTKNLYSACGGRKGEKASIDLLLNSLVHLPIDPGSVVSAKAVLPAHVNITRVERRLRESLRKSFKEVKEQLEIYDKTCSGFIELSTFHKIIMKLCMPITYQDLRWIVQNIESENNGNRINWNHFLHLYNPRKAPHVLSGTKSMPNFFDENPQSPAVDEKKDSFAISLNGMGDKNEMKLSKSMSMSQSSAPSELRRIWQGVLRECHKSDPDRSGTVRRNVFISALDRAQSAMSAEVMNRLADEYTITSGLVDYLSCFRNYLHDMVGNEPPSNTINAFKRAEKSKSKDLRALHPWEFGYHREKHDVPYWRSASSLPREINLNPHPPVIVPTPDQKLATDLTSTEKAALLSQYDAGVLSVCGQCYSEFVPIWRNLRNEFKRGQITSQRGSILTVNFLAILEHYGVTKSISKSSIGSIVRAFRGLGMQDVVKYDEFLRVCLLMKNNKK